MPADPPDLDAISAAVAAMHPAPWGLPGVGDIGYPGRIRSPADAAGIVALVNAADWLIARARRCAELETAMREESMLAAFYRCCALSGEDPGPADKARDSVRATLAARSILTKESGQ